MRRAAAAEKTGTVPRYCTEVLTMMLTLYYIMPDRHKANRIGRRHKRARSAEGDAKASEQRLSLQEIVNAAIKEFLCDLDIPSNANKRTFLVNTVETELRRVFQCHRSHKNETLPCSVPGAGTLCGWHGRALTQNQRSELLAPVESIRRILQSDACPLVELLPLSHVHQRQLRLGKRSSLLSYLADVRSRCLSDYQFKQWQKAQRQQPQPSALALEESTPVRAAFEEGSKTRRTAAYASSLSSYLSDEPTVVAGLRSLHSATTALLKSNAAQEATRGIPNRATATRWLRTDDEHCRQKAAELMRGRPLVFTLDSSRKNGEDYCGFGVAAFIQEDSLVYCQTMAVTRISNNTAVEYDKAREREFKRSGMDERRVVAVCSDAAPALIGGTAGANELARVRLGCLLSINSPCLAHGEDRQYKAGLLAMTGPDSQRYARVFAIALCVNFIVLCFVFSEKGLVHHASCWCCWRCSAANCERTKNCFLLSKNNNPAQNCARCHCP